MSATPGQENPTGKPNLAAAPDFDLGGVRVAPSACRVFAGAEEVRLEAQTMMVLVMLARAGGATVSRDELVAACWDGRIVSDDAITRTIAKVRAVARGMTPPPFIVETLPKVGYRLIASDVAAPAAGAAPVSSATPSVADGGPARTPAQGGQQRLWLPVATVIAAVAGLALVWSLLPSPGETDQPAGQTANGPGLPSAAQVSEALTLLDRDRVNDYLARGWDPNWKLDAEGGDALQALFLACERNPTHDRGVLARIAQDLVKAGVDPTMKNKWGDTALDIAMSPRYCGPKHPVVDYLKSMTPQ